MAVSTGQFSAAARAGDRAEIDRLLLRRQSAAAQARGRAGAQGRLRLKANEIGGLGHGPLGVDLVQCRKFATLVKPAPIESIILIDGRPERRGSGRGIEEGRGGQGVPRSGERSQDSPAQLRRLLDAGDADGDASRPAGPIHPRPVQHACGDHRQESRFPPARRCMGDTTS
jgi:hypothetical protein